MKQLIINPIGGLANRMRALAAGISLARDLGVDYSVVWMKNRELAASFDAIFAPSDMLDGKISYPSSISYELLYSPPRKRNLFVTALTLRRYGIAFLDGVGLWGEMLKEKDSHINVRRLFEAAFSSARQCMIQGGTDLYPYDEGLYRMLYVPSEEIAGRVAERVGQLGDRSYGIHIRRTDNAVSIQHSPDDAFIAEISRLSESEPEAKFYLATDSEDVKRKFVGIFGPRIVCSPFVADRNSVEGMKEAAVELFTLSRTNAILGSYYSSFSEAAAMIGNVRLTQIDVAAGKQG